jgi:hypothetical protein
MKRPLDLRALPLVSLAAMMAAAPALAQTNTSSLSH